MSAPHAEISTGPMPTPELIEALPLAVMLVREGRIVEANRAAELLFGASRETLRGLEPYELVAPEDRNLARARAEARRRGEPAPASYELRILRRDGARLRVELEPTLLAPDLVLATFRDIGTQIHDAEFVSALSELAARLQRERTVAGLLDAACAGLNTLGLRPSIFQRESETSDSMVLRAIALPDEFHARIQATVGAMSLDSTRFQIGNIPGLSEALAEGRILYGDDLASIVLRTRPGRLEASALTRDFSARWAIVPLVLEQRAWGLLWVSSSSLGSPDTAALSLFGQQLSSALEVVRHVEALESRNRELAAVQEVGRLVSSVADLDELLGRLLPAVQSATEARVGAIHLLDHTGTTLQLATAPPESGLRDLVPKTLPLEPHLCGQPFASRRLPAEEIGPAWSGLLARVDGRSVVVLPLLAKGRLLGAMHLVRGDRSSFSDDTLRLAEVLAAQVSVLVDSAQRYAGEQRQVRLLSLLVGIARAGAELRELRPLAERVLEQLTAALDVDFAAIHLAEEEGLTLAGCGTTPERRCTAEAEPARAALLQLSWREPGALTRAAVERRRILLDAADATAWVRRPGLSGRRGATTPLLLGSRLVGTLTVVRLDDRPLGPDELEVLGSAADQLSLAIEGARLSEDERRRVDELARINEVGAAVSGHLELPTVLQIGVRRLSELVDAPSVLLLLLERERAVLRLAAASLDLPGPQELELPLDEPSAITLAVREQQVVSVAAVETDPRVPPALAERLGHRALLALPLLTRGEVVGVVVLGETRSERRFRPGEVELATAVSHQLAAAIANARLYGAERRRVRELSLLAEIGRTVATTLEREELLVAGLAQIRTALGFERGVAWLCGPDAEAPLELAASSHPSIPAEVLRGSLSLGEALARRAIESRTAACAHSQEAAGTEDSCAVPLLARGGAVHGVLVLARPGPAVSEPELHTLGAAAAELALGLEQARSFADARRRVEELRLLLDVGRAITGSLEVDQILEASAGTLVRLVDASKSFILLLDPKERVLRGVAASTPEHSEAIRAVRIRLDEVSVAARAVNTRQVQVVADAQVATDINRNLAKRFGEKSLLALPLLVRDEAVGVVVIDDERRVRRWTAEEIERALLIGNQIAIAVTNARLYEDLRRSYGELARTQEELVKRERLAALGELAAVVAHEVRNPLGVIFNSLGSLRRILRPSGDAAMLLDIVGEESERLNHIVGDLLDFTRPHEPALQPESLAELLAGAVDAARAEAAERPLRFSLAVSDELPALRLDARMIRQALLNVLLNAVQAMPGGGSLEVRAGVESGPSRAARIEIADSGPGIPAEFLPRIFEPFFTTKATGTGLGLAVVKRIVEAHRGEISVAARPTGGTIFTLRLPIE